MFAGSFAGAMFLNADLTSSLQAAGVNATGYAVKLANGAISVIILNKDLEKDVSATLSLAGSDKRTVRTEILRAQAIDSREVQMMHANHVSHLKDGKCTVAVPHASGLRVTVG
jgi:hypothetical protein